MERVQAALCETVHYGCIRIDLGEPYSSNLRGG